MKNYERPIVTINEGLAEGVYAASGDTVTAISATGSNCWVFTVRTTINDVPGEGHGQEFQIDGVHTNPEQHMAHVRFTITYNQPITSVSSSSGANSATIDGNVVYIDWNIGTNNPTENKGFAFKVTSADVANLKVTSFVYECPM